MEDLQRRCSQNSLAIQPIIHLKSIKRIWSYRCKEELERKRVTDVLWGSSLSLSPFFSPRKRFQWDGLENLTYVLWSVSLMPEKSGETEAGVGSWQNWTSGCGFTSVLGRSSISCGPDWRTMWQRELGSYCLRSCPRGATWRDKGTSAKKLEMYC